MAQESKEKKRTNDVDDEASEGSPEDMRAVGGDALVKVDEEAEPPTDSDDDGGDAPADGEEHAAAQLGSDRYVLAGFFAAGMLAAYVFGRALQALWISVATRDWVTQHAPWLTTVSDEDKATYGVLVGGLLALVVVYRTYRRPDIRAWCDEVATELAKVVWPSRKEVTSSTFIVIVASTVATLYLALLDRLWAFVTNIVYGDGS
jgi:preprotein translocase subunit SecE